MDAFLKDFAKLRMAIRKVGTLARAESAAMEHLGSNPSSEVVAAVHQSHHDELTAVQQMLLSLDLIERRHEQVLHRNVHG